MSTPSEGEQTAGPLFVERMKRDHPDHARLYCPHGAYIGSNKMFLYKCTRGCNDNDA